MPHENWPRSLKLNWRPLPEYGSRLPGQQESLAHTAKGMALQCTSPEGRVTDLLATTVTDESIVVDAIHPLAGQALSFDIELVDIE